MLVVYGDGMVMVVVVRGEVQRDLLALQKVVIYTTISEDDNCCLL